MKKLDFLCKFTDYSLSKQRKSNCIVLKLPAWELLDG